MHDAIKGRREERYQEEDRARANNIRRKLSKEIRYPIF